MTPLSQSDTMTSRVCAGPGCARRIPRHWRKRYCSQTCRTEDLRPGARRFAYADPPYPGQSHLYRDHPDYAGEVDHVELIARLVDEFPDGWALSTSAGALRDVWAMCPEDVRLGFWLKEFVPMKPSLSIQYGWEAVLWRGGRPRKLEDGLVADFVRANPVAYKSVDGGVIGMKPAKFCRWIFNLLGSRPGDELVDLFPGSGAVAREWERFSSEPQLFFDRDPQARGQMELAS